jgi:hypothetical protein
LALYALVAGLAVAAILQGWFGVLGGNYLALSSVLALCLSGIGLCVVGAASLIGPPGIALNALVFLLFANPIAGVAMPKEFVAAPWGDVGQWFPPGAGASLLRSITYFPAAPTALSWLVLVGWVAVGLVLFALGNRNRQGKPNAQVSHGQAELGPAPA